MGGLITDVTINEAVATPALAYDLKIYQDCNEVCRAQTSAMTSITPSAMLVVSDKVNLSSQMGNAASADFTDWFVTCMPCVD